MNRLDISIEDIYKRGVGGIANASDLFNAGLERIYETTPLGPLPSNMVSTIKGINHRQTPLALPFNRDVYGLTFFTRPRLNLTTKNIRHVRQMTPLLHPESMSIQRIIRCTLDPVLQTGSDHSYTQLNNGINPNPRVDCPHVDESMVFIPMLSNLCLTLSGWNDFVVDTRTTPEGHFRESHSMVDSAVEIRNTYELSASFRNIPNNPITLLFYFWILYASKVFEGELIPYGSAIWHNEIDYNTRIYRLILDPTRKYVQHIISTGAAFPLNAPVGALGNFDSSQPYNDANDNINIRFQCMGMEYNDPAQIKDFNDAVGEFKMDMNRNESKEDTDGSLICNHSIKVPYNVLQFFNMNGYPRINRKTMELEWYVSRELVVRNKDALYSFTRSKGIPFHERMGVVTNKDFEDVFTKQSKEEDTKGPIIPGYNSGLTEEDIELTLQRLSRQPTITA